MRYTVYIFLVFFGVCSCEDKRPRPKIDTNLLMEMMEMRSPEDLAKMLPGSIMTYKPVAPPEKAEINDSLPGMAKRHWTSVSQFYILKKDTIEVELIDFKKTPAYYYIYSSLWEGKEGSIEDTVHTVEYVSYGQHVDAWIVYDKAFNNTIAYINARKRYHMTYKCMGKHIQFMKDAASKFDYDNF